MTLNTRDHITDISTISIITVLMSDLVYPYNNFTLNTSKITIYIKEQTFIFHDLFPHEWPGLFYKTVHKAGQTHLIEHVSWQADHGEVVDNEDAFEVEGLSVFHQTRAGPHHTQVQQEDDGHGDRGVDQQPRVRTLIWNMVNGRPFLPCFYSLYNPANCFPLNNPFIQRQRLLYKVPPAQVDKYSHILTTISNTYITGYTSSKSYRTIIEVSGVAL